MEATYEGKVFPVSRKAGDVCDVLIRECRRRGIDLRCGEPVNRVEYKNSGFVLQPTNNIFFTKNLVIATGGHPTRKPDRPGMVTGSGISGHPVRDRSGTHPAHD